MPALLHGYHCVWRETKTLQCKFNSKENTKHWNVTSQAKIKEVKKHTQTKQNVPSSRLCWLLQTFILNTAKGSVNCLGLQTWKLKQFLFVYFKAVNNSKSKVILLLEHSSVLISRISNVLTWFKNRKK